MCVRNIPHRLGLSCLRVHTEALDYVATQAVGSPIQLAVIGNNQDAHTAAQWS